jgi:integrase
MKSGREHVVPLCERAIGIIQAMKQQSTCDLIFPGARYNTAISESAMKQALRRASPDKAATLHGLRSSFRDWAGDKTEFKREVIEACLAHAVGNETERAYRRNDALEKRREVMTAWAKFCLTPLKGVRS